MKFHELTKSQRINGQNTALPNFEDVKRREAEELAMRESMARRRGRRSTILTGTGLTSSPELDNKTLLGA